jgi:hypothetical protein
MPQYGSERVVEYGWLVFVVLVVALYLRAINRVRPHR